ncbi:MAG: GAF domain-containing protein [Acidobacteria bacterium]|nr:GAF domain-containing protein [Acidobacteriota bacterium]
MPTPVNLRPLSEPSRLTDVELATQYFSVSLGALVPIGQVLARCVEGLRRAYQVSCCRLLIWEDEGQSARVAAEAIDEQAKQSFAAQPTAELPVLAQLGNVFETRRFPLLREFRNRFHPIWHPGLTESDVSPSRYELPWGKLGDQQSLIVFPLQTADRLLGLVTLETMSLRTWSLAEVRFLQVATNHLVSSIEAAQNFAELETDVHRLNVINEISRSLNASFSIDEIFRLLVNLTRTLVDFDLASLLLADERSGQLKLHSQALHEHSWFTFGQWLSAGFALCGRALAKRQPLVIPNFQTEAFFPVRTDWIERGFASCTIIPLLARGKSLGVLMFLSQKPDVFGGREVDILRQVGDQVAAGIQRVQTFDESEKRSHAAKQVARREELINRIGMAIGSQLHPDMVLQHAVDALGTSLDADCCYIAQCLATDMETFARYEFRARTWKSVVEIPIPVLDNPTLQRVLSSGKPIVMDDECTYLKAEASLPLAPPMSAFLKRLGVKLALYSAIYVGEKAVGFLGLHQYEQPRGWSEDDISLVRAVTRQLAVALGNAQLFTESERNRRELSNLFEMSRVLSSYTDLRELFELVTQRVAVSLGAEMCVLALLNKRTGYLSAQSPGYNVPAELLPRLRFMYQACDLEHRHSSGDSPIVSLVDVLREDECEALTSGLPHPDMPYFSNQAQQDSRLPVTFLKQWKIRNLMLCPLRMKGEVIGYIYLANGPAGFTTEDLQLLEIFAGQAAEAIVNAQLFEHVQAQAQREATLNRILTGLRESLDPDSIMENVVQQLGKTLEVDRCTISLFTAREKFWPGIQHEYCAPGISSIKNNAILNQTRIKVVGSFRAPLIINDFNAHSLDRLVTDHWHLLHHAGIRSLVMIPIFQAQELIGSIGLHHCQESHTWQQSEIDLARTVAAQLNVAIQNARLFRRVVASQQQWQASFNAMTDGVALLDADGRVVQANLSLARLCSLDVPEAMVGQSAWNLIVPKDGFQDDHPISEVLQTKVSVQTEFVDLAGHVIRETIDPIQDENDQLMGMVMVVSDVTHERQAEQEIRQRNRELSALNAIAEEITKSLEIDQILSSAFGKATAAVHAGAGLVVLVDETHPRRARLGKKSDLATPLLRLVSYQGEHSDAVLTIFKRARRDRTLVNTILTTPYPLIFETLPEKFAKFAQSFREIIDQLEVESLIVIALQSKDRVLGVMVFGFRRGQMVAPSEVQLLNAIGRQVGVAVENAQLISSLQDALKDIREASRLKDEFLATLSHELRTPLTSVTGWSEVLIDRVSQYDDDELQEGISTIHHNAENLKQLINDLLDLSRVENRVLKLELELTNINIAIQSAVQTVKQMAENKGVHLVMQLSDRLPKINADVNRLQQVFWNLLTNAIKFTEKSGVVCLTSQETSGGVEVSVTDNGIGIDSEFLPFVFERFRQADGSSTRRFGGLGIGLSLVKSFTEAHGGSVDVTSKGRGQGSTFFVRLPAAEIKELSLEPERRSGSYQISRITGEVKPLMPVILIIDDLEDSLRMLESTLKREGYGIATANTADAGLRMAERTPPDLILVDMEIPGMGGVEVFRRLQANLRLVQIPVVGILGMGMDSQRSQAFELGFRGIVTRPFRRRELLEIIKTIVTSG